MQHLPLYGIKDIQKLKERSEDAEGIAEIESSNSFDSNETK